MKKQIGWSIGLVVGWLGIFGVVHPASAAIYNWVATGDGQVDYWTNAAAWGAADYPAQIWDSASINTDNASNYTCVVDAVVSTLANKLGSLGVDNTGGGTASLVITNGGSLAGHDIFIGTGGSVLVSGSGSYFAKGQSLNIGSGGQNVSVVITGGGAFYGANSTFGVYIGGGPYGGSQGGTNCSLIVTGPGTTYTNNAGAHQTRIGKSNTSGAHVPAVSNSVWVLDGARWVSTVTIGAEGGTNNYNSLTVSDPGTYFEGIFLIGTTAGSSYNSLTISNGVVANFVHGSTHSIGNASGANYNSLNIGGAGASCVVTGQYNDVVGGNGGAFNSITLTNATWVRNGNYWGMTIGNASPSNTITISDGGTWDGGNFDSITVGGGAATGNLLQVDTGGVVTGLLRLQVGNGPTASGNRVIIDGGQVAVGNTPPWASPGVHVSSGAVNRIIVQNDGVLEAYTLTVAAGAGNMITNSGGVYQFPTVSPTIVPGGDGIFINGGTISYRGVTSGLELDENWTDPDLADDVTWLGDNALRLNASTAASTSDGYTFDTGLGATNYTRLEMVNGATAVTGSRVTIGTNGSFLVSDTTATISGAVTNFGTTEILIGTLNCSSDLILDAGGTTVVELSECSNGLVTVSGAFTSGGTVTVTKATGFVPAPGLAWDLFDWVGGSISFATTNLPTLRPGEQWDTSRFGSEGILSVVHTTPGTVVTNVWLGGASTDWGTATNWSAGNVPTPIEVIHITNNSPTNWPTLDKDRTVSVLQIFGGAQMSLGGYDLTVATNLTMDGTMIASGRETITLEGEADLNGGTLTAAASTVVIGGTGAQTLDFGGITFNELLVQNTNAATFNGGFAATHFTSPAPGATLTFEDGKTVAVTNMTLAGSSNSPLTLVSSSPGTAWLLDVSRASWVTWVTVSDSDASAGLTIRPVASSEGTPASTVNWDFGPAAWKVWVGDSTDFHAATNWNPAGAPGAGDSLLIETTTGISAPLQTGAVTIADLAIGGDLEAATLTLQAPMTVTNRVRIVRDGVLTHTTNDATRQYWIDLTVGGDLEIAAGGAINADAKGYSPTNGPGAGGQFHGGRHGGLGGANNEANANLYTTYGSATNPTTLGSGGGVPVGGWPSPNGGGAVILRVSGATVVHGSISAEGGSSQNFASGGAGGSVNLTTATLSGGGTIQADGGVHDPGGNTRYGGGGGRVAIRLTASDSFGMVTNRAWGGRNPTGGSPGNRGAPGTVYLQTASQGGGNGEMIVDAFGWTTPSYVTTTISTNLDDAAAANVILRRQAKLQVQADATLTVTGSFSNDATATLTADTDGTVSFVSANVATVWGGHTFYNLRIGDLGTKPLSFEAGKTQTVMGDLFIDRATLTSTTPDTWWYLTLDDPGGTQSRIKNVSVRDSNATNGQTIVAFPTSQDLGNNVNWLFEDAPGTIILIH